MKKRDSRKETTAERPGDCRKSCRTLFSYAARKDGRRIESPRSKIEPARWLDRRFISGLSRRVPFPSSLGNHQLKAGNPEFKARRYHRSKIPQHRRSIVA